MHIYTIYRATNTVTGKVYIGFDSMWPRRIITHKCFAKTKNTKFYNSVRKHGWDAFVWDIIYQSHDRDHTLIVMEPFFIVEYNSFEGGYNSTLGGEGIFGHRRVMSQEEKSHRSQILKGIPKSEEARQNMRGRVLSASHKEKISKAAKARGGRPRTLETRQKMSESHKGIIPPELTCPHCGKRGNGNAMHRWHFNNCVEVGN